MSYWNFIGSGTTPPFNENRALNFGDPNTDKTVSFGTSGDATDFDGSTPYSISIWFKINSTLTNNPLITRYKSATLQGPYYIVLNNMGDATFQRSGPGGVTDYTQVTTNTTPFSATNTVYNLIITSGGKPASTITMYGQGSALSTTIGLDNLTGSCASESPGAFGLDTFSGTNFLNGIVTAISFWNIELSSSDVTSLYNSGTPTNLTGATGLVSWYRFNPTLSPADTTTLIYDRGPAGINGNGNNLSSGDFITWP